MNSNRSRRHSSNCSTSSDSGDGDKNAKILAEGSTLEDWLAMPVANAAATIGSMAKSRRATVTLLLFFADLIKTAIADGGSIGTLIENLRKLERWFPKSPTAVNKTFPEWIVNEFSELPSAIARFPLINGNPAQVLPAASAEALRKLIDDDEFWIGFVEEMKRRTDEDGAQIAFCAAKGALENFSFDPTTPEKKQIDSPLAYIRRTGRYAVLGYLRKERKHNHVPL